MAKGRRLEVVIAGDASSLKKALGSAGKDVDRFDKQAGRGRGGLLAVGKAAGVAGAALGGGLVIGTKKAFDAFAEAEKVAAQTQAVIKSTGGVANVAAKDVERLAGSLSRKSGIDDEAVASGQNVLLTFTKIRNEAGAGNKVFDRTTQATLDMSVALKKDMSTAAIQVGKALNDPVKGTAALTNPDRAWVGRRDRGQRISVMG